MIIDVQNLSYVYPKGDVRAVKDVSFSVSKGEIFGFLGPSGAGKSTAQKILTGLLRQYRGEARVLGDEVRSLGSAFYERIGVSFELPNHYRRLTGLENLQFFRSLYDGPTEDPEQLLARVGLQEHGRKLVGEYSKGMQMRLNFVRALINKPELLFLDEPTSGMDPGNARLIKDMIWAEKEKGTTIFLTTHNMNVADELCDRVAFLVEGEIRLIGSPRQLKLAHGQKRLQVEYRESGRVLMAEFPLQGLAENQDFLTLVGEHEIETMHTAEATLEDVFLACTGVKLV